MEVEVRCCRVDTLQTPAISNLVQLQKELGHKAVTECAVQTVL